MNRTKIEWTEVTWNPVTGCTKVSEGCRNCYAERMAKRLRGRSGYPADDPFRVTWHPDRLDEPLRWRKPRMAFVCSMGDLFHEEMTYGRIGKVWGMMGRCPQHTFQVLTKRPKAMAAFLGEVDAISYGGAGSWITTPWFGPEAERFHWPLPNVWVGTSVEDQKAANERIQHLLKCPAAVRFVSAEPLLGPIWLDLMALAEQGTPLDWVIVGGETGPGARPMHPDWARSVRDQCAEAGVPFFLKQLGPTKAAGRKLDGRTHDEMPIPQEQADA